MASQTKQGDLKMISKKISGNKTKNNSSLTTTESYDHYIALDWSEINMAIARMSKKDTEPKVIDVPSDLKELKIYLSNLMGNKILTIEETTTSQWLYVELYDYAEKIFICDPYRNRLLSDGPKNDKIDAGKLCLLLKGGLIKEVFHTTGKIYQLRKYVSAYEDLIKYGVRLINQKWALRLSQGVVSKREIIKKLSKYKYILLIFY